MKFIPQWTSLAILPRIGTENTNDVRNSPLFLEYCYFKKAIRIASSNKFGISQYRRRCIYLLVYSQFMYSLIKNVYFKVFNRTLRSFQTFVWAFLLHMRTKIAIL